MSPLASPRDANGELIVNPLGDLRINPFIQSTTDDSDKRNNLSGIFYANIFSQKVCVQKWSESHRYALKLSRNLRGGGLSARKKVAYLWHVFIPKVAC